MTEKYMSNESDENKGENIHKPYEPDIIKGLTASSAPPKPTPPLPPPKQNESGK
jgi:hypothetical protein